MQAIINGKCSKCCPLALTKPCLLHWSIALLTMVCSVSPDFHQLLLLGHVTNWLLVCFCMQPQVLYLTV